VATHEREESRAQCGKHLDDIREDFRETFAKLMKFREMSHFLEKGIRHFRFDPNNKCSPLSIKDVTGILLLGVSFMSLKNM
jgi:hypothetical protein